jgi:hypothetical protein
LVGTAYGLKPADIGGDIVAIGPYIVSHIGLGLTLVLLYVLVILAACYSTIDGASAAPSIVAVDIINGIFRDLGEQPVRDHKLSGCLGHCRNLDRAVGSGFHHAGADDICAEDVGPTALFCPFSGRNQHGGGFVGGIVVAMRSGADLRDGGRLIGTLHRRDQRSDRSDRRPGQRHGLDLSGLKRVTDEVSAPAEWQSTRAHT